MFKLVSGKFKIKGIQRFNSDIKRRMPIRLAVMIEKHFREGFEKGGGQTDNSKSGWQSRKSYEKGGKRGILIKSGVLRRDIKQRKATFNLIKVGTSNITIKYAQTHNEGLNIPARKARRAKAMRFKVGGRIVYAKSVRGFKMPKREFIGKSRILTEREHKMIKGELKRMLI